MTLPDDASHGSSSFSSNRSEPTTDSNFDKIRIKLWNSCSLWHTVTSRYSCIRLKRISSRVFPVYVFGCNTNDIAGFKNYCIDNSCNRDWSIIIQVIQLVCHFKYHLLGAYVTHIKNCVSNKKTGKSAKEAENKLRFVLAMQIWIYFHRRLFSSNFFSSSPETAVKMSWKLLQRLHPI